MGIKSACYVVQVDWTFVFCIFKPFGDRLTYAGVREPWKRSLLTAFLLRIAPAFCFGLASIAGSMVNTCLAGRRGPATIAIGRAYRYGRFSICSWCDLLRNLCSLGYATCVRWVSAISLFIGSMLSPFLLLR